MTLSIGSLRNACVLFLCVLFAGAIAGAGSAEAESPEAVAHELKLKKVKVGKKSAGILPEIELRPEQPDGLSKEPKYRSNRVQKFAARFGGGTGIDVAFAVDEKKGTGKGYDHLIVDVTGSGDLSKGKKVSGKCVARGSSYVDTIFPQLEILIPGDGGETAIPILARFSCERRNPRESSLYITPLCVLQGDVEIGDSKLAMMVFDTDCNGVFGEAGSPGGFRARGDRIWIGKGSAKWEAACAEALPLGKYFLHDGAYYVFDFEDGDNGSKSVTVSKAVTPMGRLEVSQPGFILELVQGNEVVYVHSEEEPAVSVPSGRYRVNNVGFRRKHRGKVWELEGKPGSCTASFDIREGESTQLDVGPPLKIRVTTDIRDEGTLQRASLSFSIVGSGGEVFQYLRAGGRKVDLPEIQVRNPGNKVVEKGRFEYG